MDHGRHRRAAAVADARRGARDRARASDAAKEWTEDVADSQRDQLRVRVVPGAGHRVRDDGREERLDGSEKRDGDGRGKECAKGGEPQRQVPSQVPGQCRQRRQARNPVHFHPRDDGDEARADGRHLEVQRPCENGRQRKRDQRCRDPLGPARQEREHHEGEQADQQLGAPRSVARLHVRPDPLEEMVGCPRRREAEQILDLQDADHGADAGGESGRHRMRDELDQPA